MPQSLTPLDSLLLTVVLATLAIGLPIFFIVAIRFLWERQLSVGRSKELEKLIWQLHRIASAQEHQMNLSFPAVQPGTEEPRDLVYLQPPMTQAKPASGSVARASAAAVGGQENAGPQRAVQGAGVAPSAGAQPPSEPTRHGVNSMFGL
jgi:hypothetical protein